MFTTKNLKVGAAFCLNAVILLVSLFVGRVDAADEQVFEQQDERSPIIRTDVDLTDEEQQLLEAFFAQSHTTVTPRVSAAGPEAFVAGSAAKMYNLDGLFNLFEGILLDVLCTDLCLESDSPLIRVIKIRELLETQYDEDSIKYFGFLNTSVSVPGVSGNLILYFDLNDVLNITIEGNDGWVTTWLSASTGISVGADLLPVGAGVIPFERLPGSDDPSNSWSVSALAVDLPFYACTGFGVQSNGNVSQGCSQENQVSLGASATLVELEVNVARFEVQKSYLQEVMADFVDEVLVPQIPVLSLFDADNVGAAFIDFLFDFNNGSVIPSIVPARSDYQAFTCLDTGEPCVLDGDFISITACNGDNICAENIDGTVDAAVIVSFEGLSTGDNVCYKVEAETPDGWAYEWPYGTVRNPFWGNCDALQLNETSTRSWAFERTRADATDTPTFTFTLLTSRSRRLGSGTVVDTQNLTLNVVENDTIPPIIASTLPGNGASDVAPGSNISVTFSEAVTIQRRGIRLVCQPGDVPVLGRLNVAGNTYTLNPINDLPSGATCTLSLPTSNITDTSGNPLTDNDGSNDSVYRLTFRVDAPPAIIAVIPGLREDDVDVNSAITLTLTEQVRITRDGIRFACEPGDAVRGRLSISGTAYTLTPTEALPANATCTLTIPTTSITDDVGSFLVDNDINNEDGVFILQFNTGGTAEAASVEMEALVIEEPETIEIPEIEIGVMEMNE